MRVTYKFWLSPGTIGIIDNMSKWKGIDIVNISKSVSEGTSSCFHEQFRTRIRVLRIGVHISIHFVCVLCDFACYRLCVPLWSFIAVINPALQIHCSIRRYFSLYAFKYCFRRKLYMLMRSAFRYVIVFCALIRFWENRFLS